MTFTVDAGATPTPFSRNKSKYVAEKQSLFVSSLPEPSLGISDACNALQDMEQASVAAVPKSLGDASGRGTPNALRSSLPHSEPHPHLRPRPRSLSFSS